MQTFTLVPYPADELPPFEIVGEVDRVENQLSVWYLIQGEMENIILPALSAPKRKDDLWNTTCFEFFLTVLDSPEYWEFNMSPSGEWNVYHMDAYRQVNMQEETKICQLPFEFRKDDRLTLAISIDLDPIIPVEQKIHIGVAAITERTYGSTIYWALTHPGRLADFHLRESFIIKA